MGQRRALLLVNDKSRQGAEQRDAAVAGLGARGLDVLVKGSCSTKALSPTIVRHAGEADLVVVGGGDGTLNAAARGLIGSGLPLGVLPLGTANDLARTLGIPADLNSAIGVIADGHTHRIDLGQVNGLPFFNVASIGLSAQLAQALTSEVKRRLGVLGYAFTALRVLARARPFGARIVIGDTSKRVLTFQIAVGNGRYYGGGMAVEKDAAIDDGHLDLYSLELKQAWKLALIAPSFRQGEHGAWREVRTLRGRAFEIRTRRPRPVNADGEIVTQTPARFTLLPGAVTVFVPKMLPAAA